MSNVMIAAEMVRLSRQETFEEAIRVVLAEKVEPDDPPDPTDVSYNIALDHAAEALKQAALRDD